MLHTELAQPEIFRLDVGHSIMYHSAVERQARFHGRRQRELARRQLELAGRVYARERARWERFARGREAGRVERFEGWF